jgi:hypothetical protein
MNQLRPEKKERDECRESRGRWRSVTRVCEFVVWTNDLLHLWVG